MSQHSSFSKVTARQYIALYLYYVEGQSQCAIGRTLGTSQQAVSLLLRRGKRWIVEAASGTGVVSLPSMRALTAPSPTSSATRGDRNVGAAASRREELLDALHLRMEQRVTELAEVEECMSGNHFLPTHVKRNHYDQWEMRYLAKRGGEPLPSSAYDSYCAAQHCASDPDTCRLDCAGCRRTQSPKTK